MTKSTNFNYYEADNVYGALFFQFPKVLMYGEQYKHLSSDAKLAYMVLKDRLEYSLRNHWVDEKDHVYFIFTNQELINLFNCSEHKVIKIKAELKSAGLLLQKQLGFNPKTKKNEPNRLYLSKLDVKATDVYLRGGYGQKEPETLATSGTAKNAVPQETVEKSPQTLATSGTVKSTAYLYKDILDTSLDNIKDTQELDFSSSNFSEAQLKVQNQDLVKNSKSFLKEGTHELFLSEEAINLLQMWCNSPQQLRKMVGIILNAKNAVCKENEELGVFFVLEEEALQEKILNTLRRYFNAIRTKENKITNYENYLFGSMKNMFAEYWNNQALKQRLNSNETNKENLNMDDSVWSNSNYKNETSQIDLARLERIKLEALAKINSKPT